MKIVVSTQFRENYGAHDWDGQGECPQYWKCKGGSTYVLHDVDVAGAMGGATFDLVSDVVASSDDYSEEYVVNMVLVDDIDYNESDYIDEWESIINLRLIDGKVLAHRKTERDMGTDVAIKRKYESWTQVKGEREDYQCSYEFTNGEILPYSDACDYLAKLRSAA